MTFPYIFLFFITQQTDGSQCFLIFEHVLSRVSNVIDIMTHTFFSKSAFQWQLFITYIFSVSLSFRHVTSRVSGASATVCRKPDGMIFFGQHGLMRIKRFYLHQIFRNIWQQIFQKILKSILKLLATGQWSIKMVTEVTHIC